MNLTYYLRRINNWSKGKFCGFSDKSFFFARRAEQKFLSRYRKNVLNGHSIHILCMNRTEYISAAINCLNSFWQFNPEYSAVVWLDDKIFALRNEILERLDYKTHVTIKKIPAPDFEWQWNKLLIILNIANTGDFFCDADIIWNGKYETTNHSMFFLREFNLMNYGTYSHLIRKHHVSNSEKIYMYNVSLVHLKNIDSVESLENRVRKLYRIFRDVSADDYLGIGDIPPIRRMSEQLALSIGVQELNSEIGVLKHSDSVMDGGVAESFYLGATTGIS